MAVLKYKDKNGVWHSAGVIEQSYNPESKNAQSGVAVAEAIEEKIGDVNSILETLVSVEE